MILGLASLMKPDIEKVGDAEVVAYLMPATMRAPIPSEYVNIYLNLSGKLVLKRGMELPDDLREHVDKGLTRYEEDCLRDLRHDIYRARGGEIDNPLLNALRDSGSTFPGSRRSRAPRSEASAATRRKRPGAALCPIKKPLSLSHRHEGPP